MGIRKLLPAAAVIAAFAGAPAWAQSPLQVNLNGFMRAVPYSTAGDTCEVLPIHAAPTTVTCPDGSRGTLTLYGQSEDAPVCEVDFWYQGARWHAIVARQNGGTCALRFTDASTLSVMLR